jgi:hypothetical protein
VRSAPWLCGLVAVSGCAQIFGIDKTSQRPADAMPDAPPMSSLSVIRYSVGTTIAENPQPVSGLTPALTPAVFFAGSDELAGTVTGSDSWSVVGTSTLVDFYLPDYPTPIQRTFALGAANIQELFGVLEHPNPTAAPSNASFALGITLPSAVVAGESFQVYSIGSWTQIGLATPAVGSATLSASYAFSSVASLNGEPLQAVTTDDAMYVLRYDGDLLTGMLPVPPFDQATTPAQTVTGTMQPLTGSASLSASIDATTALQRMAGAVPAGTSPSQNWSLVAAPGYEITSTSGILLDAAGAGSADTTITATYADPFPAAWHPLLTWAPSVTRTPTVHSALGALPVDEPMFTQLAEFLDASPGLGAVDATLAAGMPLVITLAGSALSTDDLTVTLDPTQPQPVSFTVDHDGDTFYQLQVFQLVGNVATSPTALVYETIFAASALAPSFTLPANLMTAGQSYVIRAITINGGFPALATGDLTMRTLPLSRGLQDGGAFTIAAP